MHFHKMNMYWNRQPLSQQRNQFFQPPAAQGQFGGGNNFPMFGQSPYEFLPSMQRPQVNPGWNQGWGAGLQNAGGQGYSTPGYPPQGLGHPPQMKPMLNQSFPSQRFPSQGYPPQQYTPQGSNQGYGGQMPVQPAWEEPKKGGIKGFLDNIMAKFKR